MREVIAIIRMNKMERTKDMLASSGYPSITVNKVCGRGKQRGLELFAASEFCSEEVKARRMIYIPKLMISLMVEDHAVSEVVDLITGVNRTGEIGDGRIFISGVEDAVRIRTGERGDYAID
ncbi:MAG: P-II family nitrogen regulator [Methanophagales archaeon]|nr:P-II family nitrogen regulator [Methanophagales archaeon]